MSVDILLTDDEMRFVAFVGGMRQEIALRKDRESPYGSPPYGGWTSHIEGCAGEYAVAKYFGIHWVPLVENIKTARDVGPLEVRTTNKSGNRLWVFPDDKLAAFVLVIGIAPRMRIIAWLESKDAKQDKYLDDPGGRGKAIYYIPQTDLLPLSDLWPRVMDWKRRKDELKLQELTLAKAA